MQQNYSILLTLRAYGRNRKFFTLKTRVLARKWFSIWSELFWSEGNYQDAQFPGISYRTPCSWSCDDDDGLIIRVLLIVFSTPHSSYCDLKCGIPRGSEIDRKRGILKASLLRITNIFSGTSTHCATLWISRSIFYYPKRIVFKQIWCEFIVVDAFITSLSPNLGLRVWWCLFVRKTRLYHFRCLFVMCWWNE